MIPGFEQVEEKFDGYLLKGVKPMLFVPCRSKSVLSFSK